MRRVLGMSAMSAAVMVAGSQVILAQSLTSVPDNAAVMLKINNLEQTNKKIGSLCQAWGWAAMQPMLGDPLAAIKGMTNVDKGVNQSGEAAVLLFNNPGAAPAPVYLIPVTDYKTFLTNFENTQTEADGAITDIPNLPINMEPGYVANWGSFAAVSTDRAILAAKPQATKFSGLTAKEMAGKDIVLYVNFPSFKTQAGMGLMMGQGFASGQLNQQLQADPKKAPFAPVAVAAVNQVFKGLQHVINETQAMTIGLDLSNDGIQATYVAEFAPQSYLGGLVQNFKPAQNAMISGLPEGKYVVVGSTALDSNTLTQLVDDAAGPVVTEVKKLGPTGQPILDYIDAMKQDLQATRTQSVALAAAEGEPGKSPLVDVLVVAQGDAPAILAAREKQAATQQDLTQLFQQAGQPKADMTLSKNAKTIGGVQFDQLGISVDQANAMPQQQKILEAIYGQGGMQMLLGQVGPQAMLATTYKQDAKISKAVAAAKANAPLALDPAAKQVAGKLPAKSFATAYVYGDQAMTLASKASQLFTGNALPMQLPANTMPIGMAASTEGTAVRGDIFIPSSLVQSVSAEVMKQSMKQQQQQNQGGGL